MATEKNNEEQNKKWFDFYVKQLGSIPKSDFKKIDNYFLCPCCRFPTLNERAGFEICFLCNWEDDGQDDDNAALILGGPNQSYSLTEARQNFSHFLTSYRPSDTYHFERTTVKKSTGGSVISDLTAIKKQIIDKYFVVATLDNINDRNKVFAEINKLAKKL
jgi:SepF-like predicted cell division protein (DUF552 family)